MINQPLKYVWLLFPVCVIYEHKNFYTSYFWPVNSSFFLSSFYEKATISRHTQLIYSNYIKKKTNSHHKQQQQQKPLSHTQKKTTGKYEQEWN